MNRYLEEVVLIEGQIVELEDRVKRWEGTQYEKRIPGVKAEIETLKAKIPSLRGTGKLVQQKYGY